MNIYTGDKMIGYLGTQYRKHLEQLEIPGQLEQVLFHIAFLERGVHISFL